MTLKWNWGTKIIVVYSAFVVFMLTMVYLCTQQHFDLVTPDYYAKELKYQEVINATNNAHALETTVQVVQTGKAVQVTLPAQTTGVQGGVVEFYRPGNAALDFSQNFTNTSVIVADIAKFKAGMYKVKVSWKVNDTPYYNEQSLFVNQP
jgi:hypothetical protein